MVSLWRFTPPPRSLDAAAAASGVPETVSFMLSGARAHAEVTRAAGVWDIVLTGPSGQVLAARGLTLALRNPQAGVEPLRRVARLLSDGRWRVDMGLLPSSGIGRWRASLEILVDDFDLVTLEGELPP